MDFDELIHRTGHVGGHLKHRISLSANQIQGYDWVRIFSVLAPLEKRDVSLSWKIHCTRAARGPSGSELKAKRVVSPSPSEIVMSLGRQRALP